MNILKFKKFQERIEGLFNPKITSAEELLCDFVNKNNIEIVSISYRWNSSVVLFYYKKGEKP